MAGNSQIWRWVNKLVEGVVDFQRHNVRKRSKERDNDRGKKVLKKEFKITTYP